MKDIQRKEDDGIVHILYICNNFMFGGIEQYILDVIDGIDKEKYKIDILLPGGIVHPQEKALEERNVTVLKIYERKMLKMYKEFQQILADGRYDIVQMMMGYISLDFPLCALLNKGRYGYKLILHSHNTADSLEHVSYAVRIRKKCFRSMIHMFYSFSDYCVSCSKQAGQFMFGKRRVYRVLPNGIELKKFKDFKIDKATAMEKYRIPGKYVNLLTIGRICDQKNPIFLVEVVEKLLAYIPNLMLNWVGDGGMEEEIKRLVKEKGIEENFHFLGVQEHVEEIFSCCEYFFLPSRYEGFGRVFIEAQAAGLAVVTSDIVDQMVDCGGCTFIGLDKRAEEWAEQIYRLIKENKSVHIDQTLLARFDIVNTVSELEELYDTILTECV